MLLFKSKRAVFEYTLETQIGEHSLLDVFDTPKAFEECISNLENSLSAYQLSKNGPCFRAIRFLLNKRNRLVAGEEYPIYFQTGNVWYIMTIRRLK